MPSTLLPRYSAMGGEMDWASKPAALKVKNAIELISFMRITRKEAVREEPRPLSQMWIYWAWAMMFKVPV